MVSNPSFEILYSCPTAFGEISNAASWFSPTLGTPDLLSYCGIPTNSVPDNEFGYQQAKGGGNYGGICAFVENDYKEYLSGELNQPLISGKKYCIKYYVSIGDKYSEISVKIIGVHFSSNPINSLDYFHLGVQPQVVSKIDTVGLLSSWVLVEGEFVAQGGESYLTIGNFLSDIDSDTLFIQEIDNPAITSKICYFFIDDISVELCDSNELAIGFTKTLTNDVFLINYQGSLHPSVQAELFNSVGQLIRMFPVTETMNVDVRDLAAGIYFCRVKQEGKVVACEKIVKVS